MNELGPQIKALGVTVEAILTDKWAREPDDGNNLVGERKPLNQLRRPGAGELLNVNSPEPPMIVEFGRAMAISHARTYLAHLGLT